MFANPLWSVALLLSLVVVYFTVIRPRLGVGITQTYLDKNFLARWAARLYAFRTVVIGYVSMILVALPDILVQIPGMDLSFLPHPWPMYVTSGSTILLTVMKAFETKPDGTAA